MLGVGWGEEGRKRRRKEPACTPRETSGTRVLRNPGTRLQQRDIFPAGREAQGSEGGRATSQVPVPYFSGTYLQRNRRQGRRSGLLRPFATRKVPRPSERAGQPGCREVRDCGRRDLVNPQPPSPQPETRRAWLTFQPRWSSSPDWGVLLTSLDLLRCRGAGSALELRGPEGAARTTVRAGGRPSAPGSASSQLASFGHRPPRTPGDSGHALRGKPRPRLSSPHPHRPRSAPAHTL